MDGGQEKKKISNENTFPKIKSTRHNGGRLELSDLMEKHPSVTEKSYELN